jgi:hypothetical protein
MQRMNRSEPVGSAGSISSCLLLHHIVEEDVAGAFLF